MQKTMNLVFAAVLALACDARSSAPIPTPGNAPEPVAAPARAQKDPAPEDDPAPKPDVGVPAPSEPLATTKNVMIVLDASGSMTSRREGRTKIDIARDALSKLLESLPDEALRAGLIAYGHREKEDCNDIETVDPVAMLDRARLWNRSRTIQPKGMTPISSSLTQAGEQLAVLDGEKTIILLTDGENNCPGDPASTARRLHDEHGIRTHVIGFDIMNAEAAIALRELAAAGHGGYFTAATIEGLDEMSAGVANAVDTGEIIIDRTVQENFEIILDQSLRMKEEFLSGRERTTRLAIAKGALDSVLGGLAADRDNVALRRMGSDCTEPAPGLDIPFGLNRGPEIRARLASIEAMGSEGALVEALRESSRDFERAGISPPLNRRVVVITGGGDSCSSLERITEFRRMSKASGSTIRYYFIGVALEKSAYVELAKIATELGSSASNVITQKQLEADLQTIFEAIPAEDNLNTIIEVINAGLKRLDDGLSALDEDRFDEARTKAREAENSYSTTLPFRDLARRRSRRQHQKFFELSRELRELQREMVPELMSMTDLLAAGDHASYARRLNDWNALVDRYNEKVARANKLLKATH